MKQKLKNWLEDYGLFWSAWVGWMMIQIGINFNPWICFGGDLLLVPFTIWGMLFFDFYKNPPRTEINFTLPSGFTATQKEAMQSEVKH